MVARHSILPTFCRFCWWQSGKQFLEQKGCDQGFRIPDSGFQILHSRFWIPGRLLLFWLMNFSCRPNDSWPFYPPQCSISQSGDFWAFRSLKVSVLFAVLRIPNSSQFGDFWTLRSSVTSVLIAVWRLPNSTQFGGFWANRRLETSVLFTVWRFLYSSQSGGFCTLRSLETPVLIHMDIKERKSVKKSKILRKPEGNTEQSSWKWT